MNLLILSVLLCPPADVNISAAFDGITHNGSRQLSFVSNTGQFFIAAPELPKFFGVDVQTKRILYKGEQIAISTLKGPTVVSQIMSQARYLAPMRAMPGTIRDNGYIVPIGMYSSNKLLAATVSAGYGPLQAGTELPRRVFGVSIVRLLERGPRPNTDIPFPSDPFGWYEVIDVSFDERSATAELLVAHSPGSNRKQVIFEAYRIVDKKLIRMPAGKGRYDKLIGRRMANPLPVLHGVSGAPYGAQILSADPSSGRIVAVRTEGVVEVIGNDNRSNRMVLPKAYGAFAAKGRLYVRTGRDAARRATFVYVPNNRAWERVGNFDVIGLSSSGEYWIKLDSKGRYFLGKTTAKP